jgi:hypothetical protein
MTIVFYRFSRRRVRVQLHHQRNIQRLPTIFHSVIQAQKALKVRI